MCTLLLITSAPTSVHAWHAYGLAKALHEKNEPFRVFFYQDAVQLANANLWVPDDQRSLQQEWQNLNIHLPVCVSAALARGISDTENAKRHHLQIANLATGFELVGLGELADAVEKSDRLVQF